MQKAASKIQEQPKRNLLQWAYHSLVILSILLLIYNGYFKNDKIAYVDSAKILNEFKGSAEAKKAFQSKAKIWQDNIDTLTGEVKSAIQKYEKSIATMSPKEQSLSKQLIQVKQKQLNDYQRSIQETSKQEEAKLMQSVVVQINAFIGQYGKKHNYKMILIANQSGTIAYARDGLDITTEIIEQLNSDYAANGK